MINTNTITTYAQYNEDIILLALFNDQSEGFYVDVGANHPKHDSVTKLFYDRGWRGINIEPVKELHKQLQKDRPKDINLQIGIGEKVGTDTLREYIQASGHSTFSKAEKQQHAPSQPHRDYEVEIKPLKDILVDQKAGHINFLKIDAEGYEYEVIAGNDWHKFRPEVICIEANHETKDWRPLLLQSDYKKFISDGLNEYYVAEEAWSRTKDFAERVIKLDYRALRQHQRESWAKDSKNLVRLKDLAAHQQKEMREFKTQIGDLKMQIDQLSDLASLSLKDQKLGTRLTRAAQGLTADYWRFRKQIKK